MAKSDKSEAKSEGGGQAQAEQSSTEVVKVRPNGRESEPVEVSYDLPHDLAGLVSRFGEAIVASKAREKIVINLQDYLRVTAKREEGADLQALANAWKPGVRPKGATKAEKAKNLFASLSDEERQTLIKQFQEGEG